MPGYNFIFSNNILFKVGRHLAFWSAFAAWYLFMCTGYADYFMEYFTYLNLLYLILPVCVVSTYFTLYFLIPRYLLAKKYKQFIMATALLSIANLVVFNLSQVLFVWDDFNSNLKVLSDPIFNAKDLSVVKLNFWNGWGFPIAVSGFAAVIKLMKAYYIENSENERLQQQKNNHELQLLKSQLNSRFLFDTLQSIQDHVRNQLPGSSNLILKLSDLLSYILYENDDATVPLNKEIEIVEGYLNLEKEGRGNKIDIQVTKQGNIAEKRIVPLVLLPLVESCFEISSVTQKRGAGVSLDLTVSDLVLLVTLEIKSMRSFSQEVFQNSLRIKNVKQRLNSHYAGKHDLAITEDDQNYVVRLELAL